MENTVNWSGHEFIVFPLTGTAWPELPGIYLFAGHTGEWRAIYIGQCESFAKRLPGHEMMELAVVGGASEVHLLTVQSPTERNNLEAHLIRVHQPPLNDQHR